MSDSSVRCCSLQVAHLCKDVILCVVYKIRDASLLLVLSQDGGCVLGRVAEQTLHLIRGGRGCGGPRGIGVRGAFATPRTPMSVRGVANASQTESRTVRGHLIRLPRPQRHHAAGD